MMKSLFFRLANVAEQVAGTGIALLMLLTCASILLRYILNSPIPDTFDLTRLILGIAVFWGIAAACSRDDHIRNDIFHSAFKPPVKNIIDAFAQACVILFAVLLAWRLWDKTWDVARTHQETAELGWLIWPFYAAAWLATLLMVWGSAFQFFLAVRGEGAQSAKEPAEDNPEAGGII